MNLKSRDWFWTSIFSLILFLVTTWVYAGYFTPEWWRHQAQFKQIIKDRLGPDRAEMLPSGIQQIWLKEVNRVDRCTTCHLGVEWYGFENLSAPYAAHPRAIIEKHPIEKFGCTICHGGQGFATDRRSAHAQDIEHWEDPVLSNSLAKTYSITDRNSLLQINCNICHRYEAETAGADQINYAKRLVNQYGCDACHKINGSGGTIGPDLTYEGDNAVEHYDFSKLGSARTVFAWQIAHFKDPGAVMSGTDMPTFHLTDKEAQALAILMMSWRKASVPSTYLPWKRAGDKQQPAPGGKPEGQQ